MDQVDPLKLTKIKKNFNIPFQFTLELKIERKLYNHLKWTKVPQPTLCIDCEFKIIDLFH